jgi:hypothetical protein
VQVITELGLVGVVGFIAWLSYMAVLGRRVGWRQSAPLLAFIVVCNIVDPVILYPAATYTWLLLLLTLRPRSRVVDTMATDSDRRRAHA